MVWEIDTFFFFSHLLLNIRNIIINQNDFEMHLYKILTSSSGLNGFPLPPTPPDMLNPSSGSLSILTRI